MKDLKNDLENKKLCGDCTSCCEYITVKLIPPKTKKDIDEIIWYIYHDIIIFIDEEKDWMMMVMAKCEKLNKKGQCGIYKNRPLICRSHTHDECDKYAKGKYYKHLFTKKENFLKYIAKDKKLREFI